MKKILIASMLLAIVSCQEAPTPEFDNARVWQFLERTNGYWREIKPNTLVEVISMTRTSSSIQIKVGTNKETYDFEIVEGDTYAPQIVELDKELFSVKISALSTYNGTYQYLFKGTNKSYMIIFKPIR